MNNEFKCDTCETWVPGIVLLADSKEEFEAIAIQMPPMTVQLGPKLIFSHSCPNTGCTGKVNIVYAVAEF